MNNKIKLLSLLLLQGCMTTPNIQYEDIVLRPSEDASLHCFMVPKPSHRIKMSYNFRFSLPSNVRFVEIKHRDSVGYIKQFSLNGIVRDIEDLQVKKIIPKKEFKKNNNQLSIHFKPERFWPEKRKPLCSFNYSKTG